MLLLFDKILLVAPVPQGSVEHPVMSSCRCAASGSQSDHQSQGAGLPAVQPAWPLVYEEGTYVLGSPRQPQFHWKARSWREIELGLGLMQKLYFLLILT